MKKVTTLATAGLTTLLSVGAMSATTYAWHPQGHIVKQVQNQTAGGTMQDANDASSAITAAPNDVLVYTITVSNTGAAASNGNNDMASTKLTDTLPTGVELVSDPSTRTISEDLGTIKPGSKVTKTYSVKVTDTTDGDVITNKACFTGNSKVNDNPQSGCDTAVVKVHVDQTPTTPETPTTPAGGSGDELPATLPDTGSTVLTATVVVAAASVLGYAVNALRQKRNS